MKLSPRQKDILWHLGKSALCLTHLGVAVAAATMIPTSDNASSFESDGLVFLITAVTVLFCGGLFVAIYRYYDGIDDRSFNRLCAEDKPLPFLHDPAYLVELMLAIVIGTAILGSGFQRILDWGIATLIRPLTRLCLSYGVALLFTTLVSVLRIRRLYDVWLAQKELRPRFDKHYGLVRRVVYAIIFFAATVLLSVVMFVFCVWAYSLMRALLLVFTSGVILAGIGFAAFHIIRRLRRIMERRRFLRRLAELQKSRALTYKIHGRPYASLFSRRVFFGLTIVNKPHPEAKIQKDTAYCVAVADCRYRRMGVVLADGQVFRILHSIKLRQFFAMPALGAKGMYSIPVATWYSNYTFAFPKGDGERVLLIDPAPHGLFIHGNRPDELIGLDNGSTVFGYTVYGKHSFLNVMERI